MSDTRKSDARLALVTGGGSGIGRATALALAGSGCVVTICGRREAPLRETAALHPAITPVVADVISEADMARVHAQAFDIVVANAGFAESAPAAKTSLDQWRATLDANLTGAFLTVRPALAGMAKRRAGRIVFVASTAGLKGYAYVAPYVAAKHGVVGMMRALAVELAASGVTVNAVCPGFVETDLLQESIDRIVATTGKSVDDARAALQRTNPQGRFVQPAEVAAAVLYLCGEGAGSVTGQCLSISGGETW